MGLSRVDLAVVVAVILAVMSPRGALGDFKCEELPMEGCAFSVSSTGARCVLEKSMRDGTAQYECLLKFTVQTSEVVAEEMYEWRETEVCMDACGLDRMQVGMSSDGLLKSGFTRKLCSPQCYDNCPNIVALFSDLAAGEGMHLRALCKSHRSSSRRIVTEVVPTAKAGITAYSFGFAPPPLSSDDISASLPPVKVANQLGNCWECTCCELIGC